MNKLKAILFTLCLAVMPAAAMGQADLPPEYQNYRWYRFTTQNFEILSIDAKAGKQAQVRVERLRSWIYARWGLQDIPFRQSDLDGNERGRRCLIICVPDAQTYKKWFRRTNVDPKISKSKNLDGSERDVYAIWIATEGNWLTGVLPEKIGRVCLLNYEEVFRVKFGRWAHVGMSALNNDVRTIRSMFSDLSTEDQLDGQKIFTQQQQRPGTTDAEFRRSSAALCLFLRKQQGGNTRFNQFLETYSSTENANQALEVYGWRGFTHFNKSYGAYVKNLAYDIRHDRTPNMGLVWFVPKSKF